MRNRLQTRSQDRLRVLLIGTSAAASAVAVTMLLRSSGDLMIVVAAIFAALIDVAIRRLRLHRVLQVRKRP